MLIDQATLYIQRIKRIEDRDYIVDISGGSEGREQARHGNADHVA